jgi:hypothetical protein
VEEHRIRSAREIAMEKLTSVPGMTSEELLKQKENELAPVGEAIARKFLEGAIKETDVPIEVRKYHTNQAGIVKRALMSNLCEVIDLKDTVKSERALEGFRSFLLTNTEFEDLKKEFEDVLNKFRHEIEQRQRKFENLEKDRLKQMGISGSAVSPNLEANTDWLNEKRNIQKTYDPRVDKLKKNLLQLMKAV